ncbi:hypothetical protein TRFO_27407 [Tritrichomonas foetus]|uniref:RRM domain-containing protein n=1 Tax=Tritrichomonas foetus TaxID=1144522 RepID=A0A1J4K669_9EUKA|nr:hypothetical protein TRFO_27407 [Tritrichomonas foetus]|eukprot:OHT04965.1 hypothetical protein TRFO_27407 [Tritrichomonas foetus]
MCNYFQKALLAFDFFITIIYLPFKFSQFYPKINMDNREVQNRIFVKNLPFDFTNDNFKDAFKHFGPVKTCTIIVRDNGYGEAINRGIGFLTFENYESYNRCLKSKDPLFINGRYLHVMPALREGDWNTDAPTQQYSSSGQQSSVNINNSNNNNINNSGGHAKYHKHQRTFKNRSYEQYDDRYQENDTIYVANIPINVTDVQLRQLFMKYKPYELRIIENEEVQSSFAFIRIIDSECRIKAIEQMDGYYLHDRKLSVRMAGAPFSNT